jgi:hypothetical protein
MRPEQVSQWIGDAEQWPTADSYDLDTLRPCDVLRHREESLRELVPEWFWRGVPGEGLLSVGTGKAYFERRYWGDFERIHAVDPSEQARAGLHMFPVRNLVSSSTSLFEIGTFDPVPRYGWVGAALHYLFAEFCGWEFMWKLAMLVSDTLVIDAAVLDADTRQGKHLMQTWGRSNPHAEEPFEKHRRMTFSYQAFCETIEGLWKIEVEAPTPWISDGRRNMVLRRILPPPIQQRDLGPTEHIMKWGDAPSGVYRVADGVFKSTPRITDLLVYDTVSKVMGWDGMIRSVVYDDECFVGFVVTDYGEERPEKTDPSVSERLFLALLSWSLPLGLFPADVARENVRLTDKGPVWIDIDMFGLRGIRTSNALWMMTNLYKQYGSRPEDARRARRGLLEVGAPEASDKR